MPDLSRIAKNIETEISEIPMPELKEAQERAAFEATEQGSDLARLWGAPELYANPCVENRWQGWLKARRASSAQQVEAPKCVGCEGKPSAENNPCAVCGRAQQVEAVSIDSQKFRALLNIYRDADGSQSKSARNELIAHIDNKLRQAATGSADGLDAKRYRAMREWCAADNVPEPVCDATTAEELDAAIDAAILAQQEQRHE